MIHLSILYRTKRFSSLEIHFISNRATIQKQYWSNETWSHSASRSNEYEKSFLHRNSVAIISSNCWRNRIELSVRYYRLKLNRWSLVSRDSRIWKIRCVDVSCKWVPETIARLRWREIDTTFESRILAACAMIKLWTRRTSPIPRRCEKNSVQNVHSETLY